jgi:hypothetical protein
MDSPASLAREKMTEHPVTRGGVFFLTLIGIGIFLIASGLPGGVADGVGASLSEWLLSLGSPGKLVRLGEIVFQYRLWLGLATFAVGAIGDHLFGLRRVAAILKDREGTGNFLVVAAQLGLLVWICRRFNLEHRAFSEPFLFLTAVGFVVHYLLPSTLRLSFFILLSLAAIVCVLGWRDGIWLIAFSLLFITLARLPWRLPTRIALLVAAMTGVIYLRGAGGVAPWSDAIWPILWSMFLFRMILFLFDRRIGKSPSGWKESLAYFFLLPNVVFPLFPPIDYATLWRTYYDSDPNRIHRSGIRWMLVGILHLLVYRYLDHYWIESPETIISSRGLLQYVVASYLLIIRLSGQFHLIVGILHLFGFHLPRVMDHYFLATGFTDYWRRVNIYWKDFIQKLIYYPAFFRMRSFSGTSKLIIATLLGFLATWVFHSSQWFGLRGSWTISSTDIFFWSSLAVLVLANSLYEAKYGRKRSLVRRQATWSELVWHGLKATAVFVVMAILWSIWVSPTLSSWWDLVVRSRLRISDVGWVVSGLMGLLTVAIFLKDRWAASSWSRPKSNGGEVLATSVPILALAFLGMPQAAARLGGPMGEALADLKSSRLSEKHEEMQFQGYYEKLNDVNDFNYRLYEVYTRKSRREEGKSENHLPPEAAAQAKASSLFETELLPNQDSIRWGLPFRTNRWGMRDQEYEKDRPPQTMRMAVLGGSISLARGVLMEEGYESLLEHQLNLNHAHETNQRYEILNFSQGAHHLIHRILMLEFQILSFQPQVVFLTCHPRTNESTTILPRSKIPYPELVALIESAGVKEGDSKEDSMAKLSLIEEELMQFYFRKAVDLCHQRGIRVVLLILPSKPGEDRQEKVATMFNIGRQEGFDAVVDLSKVFENYDPLSLQVSEIDSHPNAMGHRLIFDQLYKELVNHPELGIIGSPVEGTRDSDSSNETGRL